MWENKYNQIAKNVWFDANIAHNFSFFDILGLSSLTQDDMVQFFDFLWASPGPHGPNMLKLYCEIYNT